MRVLALAVVLLVGAACASTDADAGADAGGASGTKPMRETDGGTEGEVSSEAPAGIEKIDHLVFIVMENRSFDHYFGTYPGADGIPKNVCVPDPFFSGRCTAPYHDTDTMDVGGPHTQIASDIDVNGGKMNGFIKAAYEQPGGSCVKRRRQGNCLEHVGPNFEPEIMGYHTRAEIPVYWDIADWGVLQDKMFAPADSWTLPAHLYLISAWSAFCTREDDPMSCKNTLGSPHPLDVPKGKQDTPYAWTDITQLLEEQDVSWGYYVSPHGTCYRKACDRAKGEMQSTGFQNVLPGFTTTKENETHEKITSYTDYTDLAKAGDLPSVSWVMPAINESDHPGHSDVVAGQKWMARMVNAVSQGPSWEDTAIFITWDDWGGFYDHVPPPKVDAQGYGIRVPGMLVSPYAKKGMIDSQVLSFDAYLKLIQDRFLGGERLDPETLQRPDSRHTVREEVPILGDLTTEFDFEQQPREPLVLEYP